jgi:hypothetical protein
MTPTGTPLLSRDWLSHSGAESEHLLLLSARPTVGGSRSIPDRHRDVRGLNPLAPRQIRDRPRQLEHAMIRPRAQTHLPHTLHRTAPNAVRCKVSPRPAPSVLRPVSSTGQWSRTWVKPKSALVVNGRGGRTRPTAPV